MRPLLQPTFAHLVCLSGQKKRVYEQTHLFIFIKTLINTYLFTFNTYTHLYIVYFVSHYNLLQES
jgi:hypothetical protein